MRTTTAAAIIPYVLASLVSGAATASGFSVLGGLTREVTLGPGAHHEDRIVLSNESDHAQEVRVFQTDYLFFADGRNLYGDPGSAPRSNARWVTFTPRQLVVPPGETASIYYVIQVPQDSALVGTYWSMLMVEPMSTTDLGPLTAEKGKAKVGLRTVLRYGIQITTHIGAAGTCDLKLSNPRLTTDGNRRLLRLELENTGERWLNPVLWAEVHDKSGATAGRFEGPKTRLYPGCSADAQFDVSALAPGSYLALVVADNQDDNVFGAQCSLDIR